MVITIREYQPSDQSQIDAMMEEIQNEFTEAITSSHSTNISQAYQAPDQKFWVALSNESVVGTIGIRFFSEERAEIKRMMVSPQYRGKTLGTATHLMHQALTYAKKHHIVEIYLGTMQQFKAAQKFYERLGFSQVKMDHLPDMYKINPMDTLFYKLEL